MGTRMLLVAMLLGLVSGGVWYAARESQPREQTLDLDEGSVEEPQIDDEEAVALLEVRGAAGSSPEATRPKARGAEDRTGIPYAGKVVDTNDKPVAGAGVVVRRDGAVLREVTTDAEGRYGFRLPADVIATPSGAGVVIALSAKGEVGYGWFHPGQPETVGTGKPPAERTIQKLVVRPGASIDVAVSTVCKGGLPATVWVVDAGFGALDPIAMGQTDGAGQLTLAGLPQGRWRLVASAPGCGRDTALIQLPQPERKTIELSIPHARRLTIRVQEKGSQTPIAAATIVVEEYVRLPNMHGRGSLISVPSEYVTDEHGVATIDGLGTKEKLTLMASAEGFPGGQDRLRRGGQGRLSVKPTETEVTIELSRPRTVRWPLEDKGHGIPPDGTAVELRPYVNSGLTNIPRSGVVANRELVVEGWAPGFAAALGFVEGFGAARLQAGAGEAVGYPTAFYPVRKIELQAKLADGAPAEGVYLQARGPGNNSLAPGAKTDAAGYAVLTELYGGPGARANCFVSKTLQPFGGSPLGSVDLHQVDGRFEFTFATERTLRLAITVDGRPAPAGLTAIGQMGRQHRVLKTDADGVCEASFVPASPAGEVVLYLRVTGYLASGPAKATLQGADPVEFSIDLAQTGSAIIKVLVPEDGRHKVTTQAWDAGKRSWTGGVSPNSYNISMGGGRADANGLVTLSSLRPGRYRAVDTYSGKVGTPFDVVAGGEPARSTLDLRKSGWVKGRVVPPSGVPFGEFTVGAEGEAPRAGFSMFGSSGGLPGRPVNQKDGVFWYRVAGDGPVTLRIYHVTCRPHATKGRVTVTGPQEGVELHAEVGPKASVRFAQPLRMFMNPGRKRSVQVRLYRGDVKGAGVVLTGMLNGAADEVEFGSFTPGRYTVWIDTITAAPLILRDVLLGDGVTDLGVHETSQGSTLRIHVKVKEGQSPARMHLTANRMGQPGYVRNTDSSGTTITLSGIGPGRFRVAGGFYAGTGGLNEEIDFDGKNDVERTIDLR